MDLDEQLFRFFRDDVKLYTKVLHYEPLPLKETHLKVKSAGIKCSLNKFMDFLDAKCITFTMKDDRSNFGRRKQRFKKNQVVSS